MIRYINQDANVITRIHDDCCIDMIEPSMRRMSSIVSDYYKRERLKHCSLSTIPKKDAQNQAP